MAAREGQQTTAPGVANKSPPTQWFVSEIQQMMHGLGDCRRPLQESAVLVEEIVQQQMIMLLYKVQDVAAARGSKLINIEDILFLLRKDKVKLRRLILYIDKKAVVALRNTSIDEEDSAEQGESKAVAARKRRKTCYDFISSIDQTGELLDLFDDEEVDDTKHERLMRAELLSRCLDPKQYLEFTEARQQNFSRRYKSQRFKDWLFTSVQLEIKPNIHAMEIISYLAYETVAQIVDLALLVKQDAREERADPLTHNLPAVTHTLNETAASVLMSQNKPQSTLTSPTTSPPATPSSSGHSSQGTPSSNTSGSTTKAKPKKKKKSNMPISMEAPVAKAILPSDIREAIRRYTGLIGPFASEMKVNPFRLPRTKLLVC